MHNKPFTRLNMILAAVAGMMATAAQSGASISREAAMRQVIPNGYQSRGKGKSKMHDCGGNKTFQRARAKQKNRARNRAAHRG